MSDTIEQILGFTIFSVVMLSALADLIFAATWAKIYFTSGVLLFSRDISVEAHHTNIPSASLLKSKLYSFWMGGLIFKELETNKYGFRREFFSFAPKPIMHGLVLFDTENNRLIVRGYLDWFVVSFSSIFLVVVPIIWLIQGFTLNFDMLLFTVGPVAFFGLIFGILYLIDYYRLVRITNEAVDLWSRKYVISQ
jgi:hypothetical protein